MNKLNKLTFATCVLLASTAQAESLNSPAGITVISPVSVSEIQTLEFGSVAALVSGSAFVDIDTAGNVTTNSVVLGGSQVGVFDISSESGNDVQINLTDVSGSPEVTLTDLRGKYGAGTEFAAAASGLPGGPNVSLAVGGKLTLNPGTPSGNYFRAFSVDVDYD